MSTFFNLDMTLRATSVTRLDDVVARHVEHKLFKKRELN
jgi:hypothetical protein